MAGHVEQFAEDIRESSMSTANLIVDHVSDEMTGSVLRNRIIGPVTDSFKKTLRTQTPQILLPHQIGHSITYNRCLIENIQKSRAEHQRKQMARKLDASLGTDQEKGKNRCEARSVDVISLLNTNTCNSIADMDRYACSEAIDCMRAYYRFSSLHPVPRTNTCARYPICIRYAPIAIPFERCLTAVQVAIKTLIDDLSVLAQERCLLQQLPDMFSPKFVVGLGDATMEKVAAETDDSKQDRLKTEEKLKVLQTGLVTIKKNAALTGHQSVFLHEVTRLSANMKEGVPTVVEEVIPDQLYETSDEEDGERDHVSARELKIESFEETIPEINLVAASSGVLRPVNGDFQFALRRNSKQVGKKKNKWHPLNGL